MNDNDEKINAENKISDENEEKEFEKDVSAGENGEVKKEDDSKDISDKAAGLPEMLYLDPNSSKKISAGEIASDPAFKKNSDRAEKIMNDHKEKMEKQKNTLIFSILMGISAVMIVISVVHLFVARRSGEINIEKQNEARIVSYQFTSAFGDTVKTKSADYPEGLMDKFKQLYAQNNDFYGWINIPNTSIDMPAYQGETNDTYFRHDNYGQYYRRGMAFVDEYCKDDLGSRNTVIHAHNYGDGLLFDDLHKYMDLDFYKANPVINFSTRYKDYKFKVIGCFVTNGSSTGDNGYLFYYVEPNMSDQCLLDFVDEVEQRSFIKTGVDVQGTDKLLTLSTCTYYFDRNGALQDARCAVVARLVRDGESETVDTSKAVKNENPRMPQLYYDVFGGTNPYKNASKWEAY